MPVSIPYSTIKIFLKAERPQVVLEFQFLIVRLKFTSPEPAERLSEVSIPYSTIKIIINEQLYNIDLVSIPYSTIKMYDALRKVSAEGSFNSL